MSDFDFDFGFTAVTEEELSVVQEAKAEVEETSSSVLTLQSKCDTLYNMIMPLLNNLAANPEKDYIYWKGKERLEKIEQFRDKLDGVYNK
jgi:hypothetical protein